MALTAYISITSMLVGTFGEVVVCPVGSCQALEPWTRTCYRDQASKAAAGGTAYVAFWDCAHGMPLALRMTPISPKEWPAGEEYFYQSQSLQSLLQTFHKALSPEEHWVYASLHYGLQAIPPAMRRFTKDTEIQSEVLFRQSASLTKLMFMVVPVAAECELCVQHSGSLEVWKRQEITQLEGALRLRVSVLKEFTPLEISDLSHAETVLFIWGFLTDIAIMARMGFWFDCHMGNIVCQLDQYGEKTFAWLDFGGRTGGDMFFRQLTDTLIAGINRQRDLGANATAKSLSELVRSFPARLGLDQVAERAQEILIETSPDYEFASHILQRVGPLRPDRLRSLQERRPRAGLPCSTCFDNAFFRKHIAYSPQTNLSCLVMPNALGSVHVAQGGEIPTIGVLRGSLRSSVWVRELIRKDCALRVRVPVIGVQGIVDCIGSTQQLNLGLGHGCLDARRAHRRRRAADVDGEGTRPIVGRLREAVRG